VNNINTRIAQILTDSKNELDIKEHPELKSPDAKTDLSFSLGTDYSAEAAEHHNESTKQSLFKRQRKSKGFSKVTFDDSLNTDILYDPNISSIHATRIETNKEKPKKSEFISVYSNRPIYVEKEEEESESEESSEEKEQSPTCNYRPDRLRIDK